MVRILRGESTFLEISELRYTSDITDIPVPDNSFDFILCSEVLEHVESPEKAMSELCRVIKALAVNY